ncbi:MAG: hypothetical protein NXI25_10570 [bacterium]|nr:hypothetical protein [bacterium]
MADQKIRDLINRIDADLGEIESAQSLIKKAGKETERIQSLSSKLINSSDRHIAHVKKQFDEELVPKLTKLLQQLTGLNKQNKELFDQINGLDFVSLKNKIETVQTTLSTKIEEAISGLSENQRTEIENIKTSLSSKIDDSISSLSEAQRADLEILKEKFTPFEQSVSSISTSLATLESKLRTNYTQTESQIRVVKKSIDETNVKVDGISSVQKRELHTLNQKQDSSNKQIELIVKELDVQKRFQRIWLSLLSVGVVLILILQISTFFFPLSTFDRFGEKQSTAAQKTPVEPSTPITKPNPGKDTASQPPSDQDNAPGIILSPEGAQDKLRKRPEYAMTYLERKNFDRLTEKYFHPQHGVHFLPYGLSSDGVKLMPDEIRQIWNSEETKNWGETPDGSPLTLRMESYYDNFIYDQEYILTSPKFNNPNLGESTGINIERLSELFPEGIFVQYPHEESSLVLVFQEVENGYPSISGIIHVEQ